LQIDHIIIGVQDFEQAAERLLSRFGLRALPGGTHPTGTANWSIPLEPPQYLELLGVGDAAQLAQSRVGQRFIERLSQGDYLVSWAVLVDDIAGFARRLARPLIPGQVEGPDGTVGRWHTLLPPPEEFGTLPFFIEYEGTGRQERHREGWLRAASPAQPASLAWIEVGGDHDRLVEWLGTADLPVRSTGDKPGLRAIAIASPSGEIIIRDEDLRED